MRHYISKDWAGCVLSTDKEAGRKEKLKAVVLTLAASVVSEGYNSNSDYRMCEGAFRVLCACLTTVLR